MADADGGGNNMGVKGTSDHGTAGGSCRLPAFVGRWVQGG